MSDRDDVGFRKPPKSSQFIKGKSGNPKGRPRGSKNFTNVLAAAVNERVAVQENGRSKTISKAEAMAKQMANKAANGEARATQMVMNALRKAEGFEQPSHEDSFDEADLIVIENVIARIKAMPHD